MKASAVDKKYLLTLNREERRAYLAKHGDKETMLVDLKKPVQVTDADGSDIKNGKGELPMLGEICIFSLKAGHQSDQNAAGKEKAERFALYRRMEKAQEVDGKIELTDAELRLTKERIGKLYMQPGIVGRSWELLDGQE